MGFKKGNQFWKSRKTHEVDEDRKIKITLGLKKWRDEHPEAWLLHKKKMSERCLGTKLSEEHKRHISESFKRSGNHKGFKKGNKPWCTGLTKETNTIIKRISEHHKGEGNPIWNGGSSLIEYPSEYNDIRPKILKRDLFTCQECHRHQSELDYPLDVHHIDFNKFSNVIENLITLCKGCHGKTRNKKEDWVNYYQIKIKENLGAC